MKISANEHLESISINWFLKLDIKKQNMLQELFKEQYKTNAFLLYTQFIEEQYKLSLYIEKLKLL